MKINKETQDINDTLNKMDLIDIYRTFHPKTTEYTFFSTAHGTFSRRHHILGDKSSLGKFKKIEIVSTIFSDHNTMRLEINYSEKNAKNTNTWRLNNMLLNNLSWRNHKIPRDKWQQKHDDPKPMGCSKSSSKREVYSNIILPQETRNISNKQTNLTPKAIREGRTKTPKVSRIKEIIKIRSEINEKEMRKQQQRSIKLKADSLRR